MQNTSRPRNIEVRLARSAAELDAAQQLRYQVFYEEWGARADALARASKRDRDRFDAIMDHLVVIDHDRDPALGQVVGNYRLLPGDRLRPGESFYSSSEFDLSPLLESGQRLLELGRSCVLPGYRSLPVIQMLWNAITAYVVDHRIELLFGCASLRGTDPTPLREQLAYLHHFHLAPAHLRPHAHGGQVLDLAGMMPRDAIDPRRALAALEPIIKGYLRLGAGVGAGAHVDSAFNAVDVCIVLPTTQMTRRYRRHFERKLQQALPGTAAVATDAPDPAEAAV